MNHSNQIFKKLNLSAENGLYIANERRESLFSNRVERLLMNTIKPDAFFCIDNKPFILFFENLGYKKEQKLKDIWNFNESPIIIILEADSVEIYNGFKYLSYEKSLELFGKNEKLNDFSYFELVTGKTWEKYQKDFDSSNRIDYHLLNNIKAARDVLLEHSLDPELINSLIGKTIFVRYLIDRKIKLDFEQRGQSREWTNTEFCSVLESKNKVKEFFKYLKEKFNGDLFPISSQEIDLIPESCLTVLVNLLSGDVIGSGQKSLFDLYDFSIIPVEFISNVYELFIGQDQQEKQGAYYTPLFLVDYILAETVEKKLINQNKDVCKVLDPSCGSGIFLVETLRKIIEKYQKINPQYLTDPDKYKVDLNKLASDNIFGVDKDHSAINVAIFSIYLTLLDYQEPSDIESFRFPILLGNNFFVSDFFDTDAKFNNTFQTINFDFILGNPPWKRGKGDKGIPLFDKYIKGRKKKESGNSNIEIEISNKEIAQAFVLRTSDFSTIQTKVSLIVTSKLLYNINAKSFRRYFLDNFLINRVFELAPVRKEVFNKSNDKSIAPGAILFYQHAKNKVTNDNVVEHITLKPSRFFSLFKVFCIQRSDYKMVSQEKLKLYDYLWKVLVYGSYLDFNLITRLKNKDAYLTIGDITADECKFLVGQGAMIGGGDKNDSSQLIGRTFLNTRTDIEAFWIKEDTSNVWNHQTVHRPRNIELYQSPMVLITEGINKYFRSTAAVCNSDVVFKSSLTAIKSLNNDKGILKSLSGILNSSFFAYFCLQTFSSSGIEREQSHDIEKFTVPFINNDDVISLVSSLNNLKKSNNSPDLIMDSSFAIEIEKKITELDSAIISAFSFSKQEVDLLDYASNITIPMLMKHHGSEDIYKPIDVHDLVFSEYIHLFFSRFNHIYKELHQQLVVEIKHTNHVVGLFFKVIPFNSEIKPIHRTIVKTDNLIRHIHLLGIEKITDRLFIQKDIRGFEENGFYIIKPNEKRLWHKAIAHLDINEFMDAILIAGNKGRSNVS
ncbi:MAG: N-6 DNA methylase [Alteromonadaceae bacterium]|nr:N-6 DNA methylase [Alteromonadaceae bacterium]